MNRQRLIFAMILAQLGLSPACAARGANPEKLMKLTKWERGVKVESRTDKAGFAYFWFYEWHLFDAVAEGEHTHGSHEWKWSVNAKGTLARMDADWLKMKVRAAENGAVLTLEITNTSDHDWPEIAADPNQLKAFASLLMIVEMREQGIVPDHYTAITECRYCGPVPIWPGVPAEVAGCPWCFTGGYREKK